MTSYYQNYGLVNILGGPVNQGVRQYRALLAHWIHQQYYNPGDTITEGIDVPFNWIPTLAVDPLNGFAAAWFWQQGPRDVATASSNDLSPPPVALGSVTHWVQVPLTRATNSSYVNYGLVNIGGGLPHLVQARGQFVLTGLGAGFGPRGV